MKRCLLSKTVPVFAAVCILLLPVSCGAATIYRCLFDQQSDADENSFPDGWTRKSGFENGIAYPHHLALIITQNPNPFGNYVLRFAMDGGGAAVWSPKIPVKIGLSYTVSVYVRTQGLAFDEAALQLDFYGKEKKPLQTVRSAGIRSPNGWQQILVGPVIAKGDTLTTSLSVIPNSATGRQDYKAFADFANFEIRESPTVSLETVTGQRFFYSTREIDVKCSVQGFAPEQTTVTFTLEDPFGKIFAQRDCELMVGNYSAAKFVKNRQGADAESGLFTGTATWRGLPIRSPGFYRVRIKTPEQYVRQMNPSEIASFEDPLADSQALTFAVIRRAGISPGGEFGWNLDGWNAEEIKQCLPVIAQSGINQLKLDFASVKDESGVLAALANIRFIGIVRGLSPQNDTAQIEAGDWAAALQPLLQKTSMTVKDWQWSPDDDKSVTDLFFDTNGSLTADGLLRFQVLQRLFDPNSFDFGIGIVWNDNYELPKIPADSPFAQSNVFFVFPADNTATPDDTFAYFNTATTNAALAMFRRFASVQPLPADDYSLETRISDFVQRLILLKVAGLDAVFLESPADKSTGVLYKNGAPNEMYLPWRTTATLLAGSVPIGSVELPLRSRNYCFEIDGGKPMMVVWNNKASFDKPIMEKIYLGEDALLTDIWGKPIVPESNNFEQEIPVTPVPVFISGLNSVAVQFRLGLKTNVKEIPAKPNVKHRIGFNLSNPLQRTVSLQIAPQPPREGDWKVEPPVQMLVLEPKAAAEVFFDLTLTSKADTGLQIFRYEISFDDRMEGAASFAVFDKIQVGNPNIFMEFVSRLNEKDELEVIQTFNNNTDLILSYDCRLSVPDRPVLKSRIMRQGFGRWEHIYTFKRGSDLLKSEAKDMTLRAIPLDGGSGQLGEPLHYSIPLVTETL